MRGRGGALTDSGIDGGRTGIVGAGGAETKVGMIGSVLGMVVKGEIGLGRSMRDGLGEGESASVWTGETGEGNPDERELRGLRGTSCSSSMSTSTSGERDGVVDEMDAARWPLMILTSVGQMNERLV